MVLWFKALLLDFHSKVDFIRFKEKEKLNGNEIPLEVITGGGGRGWSIRGKVAADVPSTTERAQREERVRRSTPTGLGARQT